MSSVDGLKVRHLLRRADFNQVKTDTPVAVRIRNTANKAMTSVTVTTATNIVLIDSDGTTTLAFSTYTTIGKLVDALNATSNWEARVLDGLRADATASQFVDGAITSSLSRAGVTVWDVKVDTSAALYLAAAAHPDRDYALDKEALRSKMVKVKKLDYSVNMGTAAANSAQVWARFGATETQLIGDLSVDTTATTLFNGIGDEDAFIGGRAGEEIVFKVKDAATLADATGNYVNVHFLVV
jgi:hypothetical protein